MTHSDKLKTPPSSENYRKNFDKIDWSKGNVKPVSKEQDKIAKEFIDITNEKDNEK